MSKRRKLSSHEDWLAARKALLEKEKAFTRLRDELSREIRALPWERVEKDYAFDGADGVVGLPQLFGGKSQLIVYHFMLGPDWKEGCKSCSSACRSLRPAGGASAAQRDTGSGGRVAGAFAARSKLSSSVWAWSFPWVSSHGSEFNADFKVSFTPEQLEREVTLSTTTDRAKASPISELPGFSVFCKDETVARSFTAIRAMRAVWRVFLGIYRFLDVVPKGRDEEGLPFGMAWVGLHDEYSSDSGTS